MAAGLIGKWASFNLVDGSRMSGLVYAVDPEMGHVVLCSPLDGCAGDADGRRVRPRVVFAHAIRSCAEEERSAAENGGWSDMVLLRRGPAGSDNGSRGYIGGVRDLERLRRLCSLLESHRLPFDVHLGDPSAVDAAPVVEVFGTLKIEAPYDAGACACENELVLSRVQTLLNQISAREPSLPGDVHARASN